MSLELAAKKIREREALDRQRAVDKAIIANGVAALAAQASRAADKLAMARSGSRQWAAAVKMASVIAELDATEKRITAKSPVDRMQYAGALATINELVSTVYGKLLALDAVMESFGEHAGNPYALARAILAIDAHAKPRSKRGIPKGLPFAELLRGSTSSTREGVRKKEVTGKVSLPRLKTKGAGAKPTVTLTASSTAVDLEGDRFTLRALEQMRQGLKGHNAFIQHRYHPVDVFGTIVDTKLVRRGELTELDMVVEIAEANPPAVQVFDMIKSGVKLGASVGVLVTHSEPSDDKVDGKYVTDIDDVIPLETSVVGLPANWTSGWTRGTE